MTRAVTDLRRAFPEWLRLANMLRRMRMMGAIGVVIVALFGAPGTSHASDDVPAAPPVRIVVLADESGSLNAEAVAQERAAINLLVASAAPTDRISIVGFGSNNADEGKPAQSAAEIYCPLTPLTADLDRATAVDCAKKVHRRNPGEGDDTDFNSALRVADQVLGKDTGSKLVFLLTDGVFDVHNSRAYGDAPPAEVAGVRMTDGASKLSLALKSLSDTGAQVWPVGFGEANEAALAALASGSAVDASACRTSMRPKAVLAKSQDELATTFLGVLSSTRCSVVTVGPTMPAAPGATTELEVVVPAVATEGVITVRKPSPAFTVKYVNPAGTEVPPPGGKGGSGYAVTRSDRVDGLRISRPKPGKWKAIVTAPPGPGPSPVQAAIEWKGVLRSSFQPDPINPVPGEDFRLTLTLLSSNALTPADVKGLEFRAEIKGDGIAPSILTLSADPARPGTATGTYPVPKEATKQLSVVGLVDGNGLEGDRRPYVAKIAADLPRTTIIPVGAKTAKVSSNGTVIVSFASKNTGTEARRYTVDIKSPTGVELRGARELIVPPGDATTPLRFTLGPKSRSGKAVALVDVLDDSGNLVMSAPLSLDVRGPRSLLSRLFPLIGAAIVLGGAGSAGIVGIKRALRPKPVNGIVAYLVRPDGTVYDDFGMPISSLDAPMGRRAAFSLLLEDTGFAKTLLPCASAEPGALTISRNRGGGLRVSSSSGSQQPIEFREVRFLTASDHGIVFSDGPSEVGSYPGWQGRRGSDTMPTQTPSPGGTGPTDSSGPEPPDQRPQMDVGGLL